MSKFLLSDIAQFLPYRSARDEFKGEEAIFLDANENPYADEDWGTINRYPDPDAKLLRKFLSERKGVTPSQLLFGNGSDEVIDLLLRATAKSYEEKVMILPPTYGMYEVLARLNRLGIVECPLNEQFLPDVQEIQSKMTPNVKVLFLCSPNNPTGTLIPLVQIEEILSSVDCLVVVDEAYIDFAEAPSALTLLNKYDNLVVLQTLSKAWGLAGIRLGMLFGPETLVEGIRKIKCPYNVNTVTQKIALKRLAQEERYRREIRILIEERKRVAESCARIAKVRKVYSSSSNFLLIQVDDATRVYEAIRERGIITRNRTNEPGLEGCIRISIGTPSENDKLLMALEEVVR